MVQNNFLFLGTEEDKPYLAQLKDVLPSNVGNTRVSLRQMDTLAEVSIYCKQNKITHVITTQNQLIRKYVPNASNKVDSIANYAGSWLTSAQHPHFVMLIVSPLKQCVTTATGKFILARYISKITRPDRWVTTDTFSYTLCDHPMQLQTLLDIVRDRTAICSIDIETRKDLSISSIAFTCLHSHPSGALTTSTYVIPLPRGLDEEEYEFRFHYIREICATNTPKLGQNFKYDIIHLMRFGCPVRNWRYDTAIAHHSWFSELKKDLSSLAAFYVREYVFWDVETFEGDSDALYHYNGMDTWSTLWAFMAWLYEAPAWAKNNYAIQFRVQFPSLVMETTGILVNEQIMEEQLAIEEKKIEDARRSLEVSLDVPGFNPSSPKQVQQLLTLLGVQKKGTDEKILKKFAFAHPLNAWLVDKILAYRKAVKLSSTYLSIAKLFRSVMLYNLTSYATRTGRLASSESAMWCGANIQNIPRGSLIKRCYIPFPGFKIGEVDKAQAESYCTGYISGDTVLIEAVTGVNDFHALNGAKFFGVPYESICRNEPDGTYTILNKILRQLAKPINHGCSYCMGAKVLVDTMGLELIFQAGALLGITKSWSAEKIAEYLILRFSQTYKILTKQYWPWVANQVTRHKVLIGATGWTRYCFGRPDINKHDLNAYIAHAPQSLNAMQLNDSVFAVFMEVWMPHHKVFKLCAQIHDSILFQVADGHEHLAVQVKEIVERTSVTQVTDIFGITREMRIPADLSNLSSESWYHCK